MTSVINPDSASRYLTHRIEGFEKDMAICLIGRPRPREPDRDTHAYFPALMTCCGMLELLGSLYVGIAEDVQKSKLPWIEQYCKAFLKKPEYSREHLDLLFYVLRNPTVHLSTGSGVRIMPWGPHEGKRITFHIDEQPGNPAIELVSESAAIPMWSKYWSCPYDYKLKVYLPSLKEDICKSVNGAGGYREKLMKSDDLLGKFERCMRHIYREPTSEATEKS